MVYVDLTEGQIGTLISVMESALYWNTDNPTIDDQYNAAIMKILEDAVKTSNSETYKKTRFENIIR